MDFHIIYSMSEELTKVAPITRTMKVNGMKVTFEVDTGCDVTKTSFRIPDDKRNSAPRKDVSCGEDV